MLLVSNCGITAHNTATYARYTTYPRSGCCQEHPSYDDTGPFDDLLIKLSAPWFDKAAVLEESISPSYAYNSFLPGGIPLTVIQTQSWWRKFCVTKTTFGSGATGKFLAFVLIFQCGPLRSEPFLDVNATSGGISVQTYFSIAHKMKYSMLQILTRLQLRCWNSREENSRLKMRLFFSLNPPLRLCFGIYTITPYTGRSRLILRILNSR